MHLRSTEAQWGFGIRTCQTRHCGSRTCQTHRHSKVLRVALARHTGTVSVGFPEAVLKHTGTVRALRYLLNTQAQWVFRSICPTHRHSEVLRFAPAKHTGTVGCPEASAKTMGFSEASAKRRERHSGVWRFAPANTQAHCIWAFKFAPAEPLAKHMGTGGSETRTCQTHHHGGFFRRTCQRQAQWGFEIHTCQTQRHSEVFRSTCQTHRHSGALRPAPAKHTGTVGFSEALAKHTCTASNTQAQ